MNATKISALLALCLLVIMPFGCEKDEPAFVEPRDVSSYTSPGLDRELEDFEEIRLKAFHPAFSFEDIEEARGILTRIDLRKKGSRRGSKFITIWEMEEEFNLLDLVTGIMADIAFLEIPPGDYDLAVIHMKDAWVKVDGKQYDLRIPKIAGGNYLFMRFIPPVLIGEQLSFDLTLDIDVSRSFYPIYSHGYGEREISEFLFNPLIIARNQTVNGSVAGAVVDGNGSPLSGARVTINSEAFNAETFSLETGEYQINGIPAGDYTLKAGKEGYASSSKEVEIIKGNYIFRNLQLTLE